jgi:hypothetical protein
MRRFASFEARQVLREFNKAADALSNQAIDDWRSGINTQLWSLEAVATALGNAELKVEAEEDEAGEEGAAGGAAAAVAAGAAEGEGHARGGSGGGVAAAIAAAESLGLETAAGERAEDFERVGPDTEGDDSSSSGSGSSSEEEDGAVAPKRVRRG